MRRWPGVSVLIENRGRGERGYARMAGGEGEGARGFLAGEG